MQLDISCLIGKCLCFTLTNYNPLIDPLAQPQAPGLVLSTKCMVNRKLCSHRLTSAGASSAAVLWFLLRQSHDRFHFPQRRTQKIYTSPKTGGGENILAFLGLFLKVIIVCKEPRKPHREKLLHTRFLVILELSIQIYLEVVLFCASTVGTQTQVTPFVNQMCSHLNKEFLEWSPGRKWSNWKY